MLEKTERRIRRGMTEGKERDEMFELGKKKLDKIRGWLKIGKATRGMVQQTRYGCMKIEMRDWARC